MEFRGFVILGALFLLTSFQGCSSSSSPIASTVRIPGAGSTFTFLNTSDSSGIPISNDTALFLVLGMGSYAGYSSVMSIRRTTFGECTKEYVDTLRIRVLENGDLSELFSIGDYFRQWIDLPFSSGKSQSQESDSIVNSSVNGALSYDTAQQTATPQGLTWIQVKGVPRLALTVNYTGISSGMALDSSISEYRIKKTQYYSIPSEGILFAGSRDSRIVSVWAGGDQWSEGFAYPRKSTLIDYKILP